MNKQYIDCFTRSVSADDRLVRETRVTTFCLYISIDFFFLGGWGGAIFLSKNIFPASGFFEFVFFNH